MNEQRNYALQERLNKSIREASTMIWVTFQKVGFHSFPAAQIDPALEDVSYLGFKHRHLFKFKVWIEVFHNDREIEFHQFLSFCESLFSEKNIDINFQSVEMLADNLYTSISKKFPDRDVWVEVSEDGECGCFKQYDKE